MNQHDAEFLRRRVKEVVAKELAGTRNPLDPDEYGPLVRRRLPADEQEALLAYGPALLDELFASAAREQTKGGPSDSEQVEAFPLDAWIGAATPGHRVRYRHATWRDHLAHREHQITNVRRVTRSFDVEEQRREKLADAGMADDPDLTTEEAVARLEEEGEVAAD